MRLLYIASLVSYLTLTSAHSDFLTEQKRYSRVRNAISEKGKFVSDRLNDHNISADSVSIIIVAYKAEQQLAIYAKNSLEQAYKEILTYVFCHSSGGLGPKRRQGDFQVPEGFYYIDRFNPDSHFHLSLGINYPNQADKKKSNATSLGGDIFIHGGCRSIGCISLTDDKIKELYLFAIHARNSGQLKIPVYIFPFRMNEQNFSKYKSTYDHNPYLLDFWTNLKVGYDKFHGNMMELKVRVDGYGNYLF